MNKFVTLFFSLLFLVLQACQTPALETEVQVEEPIPTVESPLIIEIEEPTIPPEAFSVPIEQAQIYNLFLRGAEYAALDKQQRSAACKQLKSDYKELADWQSAWLLVYAVNYNFTCLSLNKTAKLLHEIEKDPTMNSHLQWINNNQINNLKILQKTATAKANLAVKLEKSQEELKLERAKIEELKAIESDINRKLDNAEIELEKESSKIDALKTIESDLNKKLDE